MSQKSSVYPLWVLRISCDVFWAYKWPATFSNLNNDVFHDYIEVFIVVYLDNIVIYSESLEDHLHHVRLVLSRLREHQLHMNLEKC